MEWIDACDTGQPALPRSLLPILSSISSPVTNELNTPLNSCQVYHVHDMAKQCNICGSNVASLRVSPQHSGQHNHAQHERACKQCWEAWLSMQVEENPPYRIECMFCNALLDAKQIQTLGYEGTWKR